MKKVYQLPKMSICLLDDEDILTTSTLSLFADLNGDPVAGKGDSVTWKS
ncbi:MAG: hypothetical protein IJW55_04640 [Clostridia bacterium]|nr:hypothetical protein [Clostridia bacterium]